MYDNKSRKAGKVISWLQIAIGFVFLLYTAFSYVDKGHHLPKSNIALALIFGVCLPMSAASRLYRLRKEEREHAGIGRENEG